MKIVSPLTGLTATEQVPNTPYWIDPECGLWFQANENDCIPENLSETYSDGERVACAFLAEALRINWMRGDAKLLNTLDLLARDTGMRDSLRKLGIVNAEATSDWVTAPYQYDLITMLHSFQGISSSNVSSRLSSLNCFLKPGGILFIRMPDHDIPGYERDLSPEHFKSAQCFWSLDAFLEALWRTTSFKIAETYSIGNGQRDYILKKIMKRPTMCIGMIAKNEERDLPVCLESLKGVADGICLIDTGSTDKTVELAHAWAAQEGFANEEHKPDSHITQYLGASEKDEKGDWKLWNFGKARNQYVEWIDKNQYDWILWVDADDRITNPRQMRNARFLDQYDVQAFGIESGGLKWHHHRLWKTGRNIKYAGRCHEYPDYGHASTFLHPGIAIHHNNDPTPGMENSNPRNLRILEREFQEEPSARCAFYLGNTFKDAGRHEEAIQPYAVRLKYGKSFWDEYMFTLLYKGRCERLADKLDDARRTLLEGVQEHPGWAEFWMELHHVEQAAKQPWKAMGYALQAKDAPIIPTSLFREPNLYTDQPYRMISWGWENLGYRDLAIQFAEEAKPLIGGPDADWDKRIERLKGGNLQERTISKPSSTLGVQIPCIVLNRAGALGDIIMTLNHVQALKDKYPGHKILYRCHPSSAKHLERLILESGCDAVVGPEDHVKNVVKEFNLVGYPLAEGYPEKSMKLHLLEYFAKELGVPVDWDSLRLERPECPKYFPERYITCHPQAGWSVYKNWPKENWEQVISKLNARDIDVVQIGGPDDTPLEGAISALGRDFPESLAILANGSAHMGVDSWTNHALNIVWKDAAREKQNRGVILWGSTQASAAGYLHNTNISSGLFCQPCFREDPKISNMPRGVCTNPSGQTYENPKHACMQVISVDRVFDAILNLWESL